MILNTKHFGKIEIDEEQIITFEEGLLGFEFIRRYILIHNPDKEVPFHWLQAVDDPGLAFVVTIPFLFKEDYAFDIPDKVIKQLGIQRQEDVAIYSVAVVPDDIREMTINLQGPLIIHGRNKKGKQIVLDNNAYSLKYRIFQETAQAVQE